MVSLSLRCRRAEEKLKRSTPTITGVRVRHVPRPSNAFHDSLAFYNSHLQNNFLFVSATTSEGSS